MCECCDTKGIISKNSGFPHLYHRWKYSSMDKAIYLTRDDDTGISYMVFNAESDSGYSLDEDDGDRIIIEYAPFGLSSRFSRKVVFNRIFEDNEKWFDENKD